MSGVEPRYGGSSIVVPPTFAGVAGRAWTVPLVPPDERPVPDWRGTVAAWIVDAPAAHPLWNFYCVCVIHLRVIDGVRPAIVRLEGATHELMILALDPGHPVPALEAFGRCESPLRWLSPIDVMEQFIVADDAQAEHLGELATRAIVDGLLSPDQDFRRAWARAIAHTASHLAEGGHAMRVM